MVFAVKSKNTRKPASWTGRAISPDLDEKEMQLDMRILVPEGVIHHRCWHCNDFYFHTTGKV